MRYILFLPLLLLLIAGCGKPFFEKEMILNLKYKPFEDSQYIYGNEEYNFTTEKELFVTIHFLVKLGANRKAYSSILAVQDESMARITEYNARVIKEDGSSENYSKDDLYVFNSSDKSQISEENSLVLPINEKLEPGDLIEVVYRQKYSFPKLGGQFSNPTGSLAASNISCSIITPANIKAKYKLINDNILPVASVTEKGLNKSTFEWSEFYKKESTNPYSKKRNSPSLLICYPFDEVENGAKYDWKSFGNWYLDLIAPKLVPDDAIKAKAGELTAGLTDEKAKMDTIFKYCQKSVRYEQVYFTHGAIIPNPVALIFGRGFGDCKDYSSLIYAMAKSAGLNPALALCYRGRGIDVLHDIPVSQFNHMITCFNYKGQTYWYDGTNRNGLPGVSTSDLINHKALVLEKNDSRILTIPENKDNLLSISGTLKAGKTDLNGRLNISFYGQFAVDLRYFDFMNNKSEMKELISRLIRKEFNENMIVDSIITKVDRESYQVNIKCLIPNSLTSIDSSSYLSLKSIFPKLLPQLPDKCNPEDIFYNPSYNKCIVDIKIENMCSANSSEKINFVLKNNYELPAGPFNMDEAKSFIELYKKVNKDYTEKYKLQKMVNQ